MDLLVEAPSDDAIKSDCEERAKLRTKLETLDTMTVSVDQHTDLERAFMRTFFRRPLLVSMIYEACERQVVSVEKLQLQTRRVTSVNPRLPRKPYSRIRGARCR